MDSNLLTDDQKSDGAMFWCETRGTCWIWEIAWRVEQAVVNSPGNANLYHLLVYLPFPSSFVARNFKPEQLEFSPLFPAPCENLSRSSQTLP